MSDEKAIMAIPMRDIERMAEVIARSKFFGVQTPDQAMALMLVAQAEGRHPASVAMDYHIIQGRPALKADAMLSRYQAAGGKVEWHEMTDQKVSATFTHPSSGSVRIDWDIDRAKRAGLMDKPGSMFNKYPRPMLRSRVVSEGTRASLPGVLGGMYTPEEVGSFEKDEVDVIEHDEKVNQAMVKVRENLILNCEPIGAIDPILYAEILSLVKSTDNLAQAEISVKEARHSARVKLNETVKEVLTKAKWDKKNLDNQGAFIFPAKLTWEKLTLEEALVVHKAVKDEFDAVQKLNPEA